MDVSRWAMVAFNNFSGPLGVLVAFKLLFGDGLPGVPGGRLGAALLSGATCCGWFMFCQRQERLEVGKMGKAAQTRGWTAADKKKPARRRARRALPAEPIEVKQGRLQAALREARADVERLQDEVDALPPLHEGAAAAAAVAGEAGGARVRMGRSTDADDEALVFDLVSMINSTYRGGYADILADGYGDDPADGEQDEDEEVARNRRFTRTSVAEMRQRLHMCSDPRSARKLLLALQPGLKGAWRVVGCASVTAPYGNPELGEWGLVCVDSSAQGQGVGSLLAAAAESHCVLRGCSVIQLEYFLAEYHEYSARLLGWYSGKLGYERMQRRQCGNQLRRYPTTVPMFFEIGHKSVSPSIIDTGKQLRLDLQAVTEETADRHAHLAELETLAKLPTRTLSHVPEELFVQVLLPLCGAWEQAALAMTCTQLRDALRDAPREV